MLQRGGYVVAALEQKIFIGRIPIESDASGEPDRSLFPEDSEPVRAFDEVGNWTWTLPTLWPRARSG